MALSTRQKAGVARKAKHASALKTVSDTVSQNLTDKRSYRSLTDKHCELLLVRVAAGGTVRQVCQEMGVCAGLVHSRSFNDEEFGRKLQLAREHGAQSLFEMMIDIGWNENESVERSKLKVSVLDRIARTYNRNLSDRQQVDVRQAVAFILPPDANKY